MWPFLSWSPITDSAGGVMIAGSVQSGGGSVSGVSDPAESWRRAVGGAATAYVS